MNDSPTSLPSPASEPKLVLTGQQQALLRVLQDRSSRLANIYLGGITVFCDKSNPDRIALSAHAMRELMKLLPAHLDVPTPELGDSLKARAMVVRDNWNALTQRSACFNAGQWSGDIDTHLRKFLSRVAAFLEWLDKNHPRRATQIDGALTRLDVSSRVLPGPLAKLNVDAWQRKLDYFTKTSHHGATDEAQHETWVHALEIFLLDRMAPRTFVDLSEIDALIAQGEADGKP